MNDRSRTLELALFLLILVIGGSLRVVNLESAPPGLTHDEADHSVDAVGVLQGRTPIYFTVGYGREPLFDYATSFIMLVVGRNFLASRIAAALFGVALLVLVYAWVRRATSNRWLALATMAGLAFSFWGISTSREALRSETLPVLFMAAALAMRRGIVIDDDTEDEEGGPPGHWPEAHILTIGWFVLAGILLGLSMYTYLAARLMWLVFPAFFLFLSVTQPGVIRHIWPGLAVMLGVGALIASPLFIYLLTHPGAEARIGQLSGPITATLTGDLEPLRQTMRAGLGMITIRGDDLWLYNIPNKPLLGPVMSLLFYLGVSVGVTSIVKPYRSVRRGLRTYDEAFRVSSASAFMILTLAIGMIPALLTGVGASNTRVIGMQPALYYFPALGVVWLANWAEQQIGPKGATALWVAYGGLLSVMLGLTISAYFGHWNNARDVRVAYHTNFVSTMRYLDAHPAIGPDVAISTITPGQFHDPAIARVTLRRDDLTLRWFDGRTSLVLPEGETTYFFPGVAQIDPLLERYLTIAPLDTITLRPSDFDPTVTALSGMPDRSVPMEGADFVGTRFGDVLTLEGYSIIPGQIVEAGQEVVVLSRWHIERIPEAEITLFTHVLDANRNVIAQQDLLSAPSWGWIVGDSFIQIHRFTLPEGMESGSVQVEIGAYSQPDIIRLPVMDSQGLPLGDSLPITSLQVATP